MVLLVVVAVIVIGLGWLSVSWRIINFSWLSILLILSRSASSFAKTGSNSNIEAGEHVSPVR